MSVKVSALLNNDLVTFAQSSLDYEGETRDG